MRIDFGSSYNNDYSFEFTPNKQFVEIFYDGELELIIPVQDLRDFLGK